MGTDGKWEIPLDKPLKAGDMVSVTQSEKGKKASDPLVVLVTDVLSPKAPVVTPVKPGDTSVSGKAEPGSTVTVTQPNGKDIKTPVDKDGNWKVPVTPLKPGDKLVVTTTDTAGNTSKPTVVVVPNRVSPESPVVNPVKPGDTSVIGKAEPGSTVTVTQPNGKDIKTPVDKDGNWKVPVTPLKPGDKLVVTTTDPAGNTSKPTVVVVPNRVPSTTTPSTNHGNDGVSPSTLGFSPSAQSTSGGMNTNRLVKELPNTGEESSMSLSLLGGATILGLLGAVQMRRKRDEQD